MTRVLRKRKRYFILFLVVVCLLYITYWCRQIGRWKPLQPLMSAESEAQRLLKFITVYHYECNSTIILGNRSDFQICSDNSTGVDLDTPGVGYSIWKPYNSFLEKYLAHNYSYQMIIITNFDQAEHEFSGLNSTSVLKTFLVANDNHDFSRNSYGQMTFNTILDMYKHPQIDILKLDQPSQEVQLWEIIHFMNKDLALLHVKQLHIVISIDKNDEDYLYNWYRSLYNLFYEQGFRLYRTTPSSPLCVQVTVMESCVYWLSWIKNPGSEVFVMHPPADFGTLALEQSRLYDLITNPDTQCGSFLKVESLLATVLPQRKPLPGICMDSGYGLEKGTCKAVILNHYKQLPVRQILRKFECVVYQFVKDKKQRYYLRDEKESRKRFPSHAWTQNYLSPSEVLVAINAIGPVDLLDINLPGSEWEFISGLMNSGAIQNVTQLLFEANFIDNVYGQHPNVLRKMYSELRRLKTNGFQLFDYNPCHGHEYMYYSLKRQKDTLSYCYKLSFLRKKQFYS